MNLSDVARLERESGCEPVSDTKQRIDRSLRRHCPNGQLHPGGELLSHERSDGADLHCQLVRVHHYGPVSPTPVSSHVFVPATIVKAAQQPNPRLRYVVPAGARPLIALLTSLPGRLADRANSAHLPPPDHWPAQAQTAPATTALRPALHPAS